jgi:hypothetical protein
LSPNIIDFFGYAWRGAFALAMAAVAHAMVQNNDMVSAFLELIITDCMTVGAFEELVNERETLMEPIVRLAPPLQSAAIAEESVEWVNGLIQLIDAATNSESHPFECVPWF